MENLDKIQTTQIEINKENQVIKSAIQYELVFNEFFKELGLKPAQRELIRAFIVISKGQTHFEVSNNDLANVLYKKDTNGIQKNRGNLDYARKVLVKWQEDNKIELIRIVRQGQRKTNESGQFEYSKTQYEFVLLAELAVLFSSGSQDLETALKRALEKIKARYKPKKKAGKTLPTNRLRIAKNTILTKFKRVFDLAIEANLNPKDECQGLLNQSQSLLNGMEKDWTEENKREAFITEFESLMNMDMSLDE